MLEEIHSSHDPDQPPIHIDDGEASESIPQQEICCLQIVRGITNRDDIPTHQPADGFVCNAIQPP